MTQQLGQNKFVENALKYGFSLWGTAKTGQTVKLRTGDDGDLKKGYPKSGVRFVDNGDGTITDNATGLMWVKDPSYCHGVFGESDNPEQMLWNYAIDECLALNYAGHNDWRLPNIKELLSIVDYGRPSPSINPVFTNTQSDFYWTSTKHYYDSFAVWAILFNFGSVSDKDGSIDEEYARPVRLGG